MGICLLWLKRQGVPTFLFSTPDSAATKRPPVLSSPPPFFPVSPPNLTQVGDLFKQLQLQKCVPYQNSLPGFHPHSSCQSGHMAILPARGSWLCSSLTAHAGLTHGHPVAWHTGLCAAMAKCPLPDTVRPACNPADGRRWGLGGG